MMLKLKLQYFGHLIRTADSLEKTLMEAFLDEGKSLSRVQLFVTPWTAAHRAPPSMGLSRQEYWSGLPLPSPQFFAR